MNLVDLLQNRASQQPDSIAYTFLEDGKNEKGSLTYAQLDKQARMIATYLQSRLTVGARVLLIYPQGLEAIITFFGCLYAGVVAIPAPALEAANSLEIDMKGHNLNHSHFNRNEIASLTGIVKLS